MTKNVALEIPVLSELLVCTPPPFAVFLVDGFPCVFLALLLGLHDWPVTIQFALELLRENKMLDTRSISEAFFCFVALMLVGRFERKQKFD